MGSASSRESSNLHGKKEEEALRDETKETKDIPLHPIPDSYAFPHPGLPLFETITNDSHPRYQFTFVVIMPNDSMCGETTVAVRGNVHNLSWTESKFFLQKSPYSNRLFTGSIQIPAKSIPRTGLEYKYFIHSSVEENYEYGHNRKVQSFQNNERYDIWRVHSQWSNKPTNYFSTFMLSKWAELTTSRVSVNSWIPSYIKMITHLKESKLVSAEEVEKWCSSIVNAVGSYLHPVFVLSILLIRGSVENIKTRRGSWWTRREYTEQPLLHILSHSHFWDESFNYSSILDKETHYYLCEGVRGLVNDEVHQSSYHWLRLAPLHSRFVQLGRTLGSPISLTVNHCRNNPQAAFLSAIESMSDFLLVKQTNTEDVYPVLSTAIRTAPCISVLSDLYLKISHNDDVKLVFYLGVENQIAKMTFPKGKSQRQTIDSISNIINVLSGSSAFTVCSECLRKENFAYEQATQAQWLISATTKRITDEGLKDHLQRLGDDIRNWLCRYYSGKRLTLRELSHDFTTLSNGDYMHFHRDSIAAAYRDVLHWQNNRNVLIYWVPRLDVIDLHGNLAAIFLQHVLEIVPSFISGSKLNQKELLKAVSGMRGRNNNIRDAILECILQYFSGDDISLEIIFANADTWIILFNSLLSKLAKDPQEDGPLRNLRLAKESLQRVSIGIKTKNATVKEAFLVRDNCGFSNGRFPSSIDHSPFIKLQEASGIPTTRRHQLEDLLQTIREYEQKINHLFQYIAIFWGQLLVADKEKVESQLVNITRGWENEVVSNLKRALVSLPNYPEGYYERRTSDIFILMWKQEAEAMHPKNEDIVEKEDAGSDEEEGREDIENEEPQQISYTWPWKEIEDELVPRVNKLWKQLFDMIDNQTIPFTMLEKWFRTRKSQDHIKREISLLSLQLSSKQRDWAVKHSKLVCNFFILERHRECITCLITLLNGEITSVFAKALEDDPLYQKLERCCKDLATKWDKQTLATTDVFVSIVMEIFKKSTQLHLHYLKELSIASESTELISWLLKQANTAKLNELFSITKQNTDDTIVVSGIACLRATRDRLAQILYPSEPFVSLSKFLEEFVSISLSDESLRQLETVRQQFSFLQQIFEQKTRNEFMQACFTLKLLFESGKYCWSTTCPDLVVKFGDNDSTVLLDELIDLRNKILLGEPPEEMEGTNIRSLVDIYIPQLKEILLIHFCVQKLQRAGHLAYLKYEDCISLQESLDSIRKKVEYLEYQLKEWQNIVLRIRDEFYIVNFYTISHLISLLYKLDSFAKHKDSMVAEEIYSQCRYIASELEYDDILPMLGTWKDSSELGGEQRLQNLAHFLETHFLGRPVVSRVFTKSVVVQGAQYVFEEGIGRVFIATTAPSQILDAVTTLYVQKGRLPEPDEVLFCDKHTTIEEIELIVRRWSYAGKHKRKERLFCMVNTELLSYTVQSKCARLILDTMNKDFAQSTSASFIILSGTTSDQHLVSALSHLKLEIGFQKESALRELYAQIAQSYTKETKVVRSLQAGAGKTNIVKQYAAQHIILCCHIVITKQTTADEIIQRIPKTDEPVLIHFDIGAQGAFNELNSLLYQLIVLGVVYDTHTGRLYSRKKTDAYFVELANSYQNRVHKIMFLCNLLPSETVQVSAESFTLDKYDRVGCNKEKLCKYECRKNHYEKIDTIKYLQAFRAGFFADLTSGEFELENFETLSARESFALLLHYLPQETRDNPSFVIINNFCKVLYQKFSDFGKFPHLQKFAAVEAQCNYLEFFLQYIIRTASDFIMRLLDIPSENIRDYSEIFRHVRTWEERDHPFVLIRQNPDTLAILSMCPAQIQNAARPELIDYLSHVGFNITRDWNALTYEEGVMLLQSILVDMDFEQPVVDLDPTYVLTFDNIMKMISIFVRLESEIPAIIMGATGCGKTALIRFMCSLLSSQLFTLNVHGGTQHNDIVEFMENVIATSDLDHRPIYVFFDEINTSDCLSLFYEIIFHRCLDGKDIPGQLRFIAACNPYVFLDSQHETGLQYEQIATERKLQYRVHPLPNTMLEICYHFGTLNDSCEKRYIRSMVEKDLVNEERQKHWKESLIQCIATSHQFIRTKEKGTCSLRDVARCIKLFRWFQEKQQSSRHSRSTNSIHHSIILALGVCYRSRLTGLRQQYDHEMTNILNYGTYRRSHRKQFQHIIHSEQKFWVKQMNPGEGIALNEALCENIFMIVVCVLNKIPIFVIGKPGSSKSLAVELIGRNFNGQASTEPFFQDFPAIEIFSYQCSPLSTSQGIEKTFDRARQYQQANQSAQVVVLLDEVGLAEQSPHLPLKVLHKILEAPDIAVIGISNWALDLAKMNRGVHLSRPEPTIADLKKTAKRIVDSKYLEASLDHLAQAYHKIYKNQRKSDFFGLRDFYHLVKYLHRNIETEITTEILYAAICRNFGGHPEELERILKEFATLVMGFESLSFVERNSSNLETFPEVKHIKDNLCDLNARHLMVLTRNNAALNILLDQHMTPPDTVVLFGSDFPADQSDLFILLHLQQIKTCMASGKPVILVHQENLFESLYDMLNQHYTEYGGQRYVRLAMGANNRSCPVHNDFRVIVIVDSEYAYNTMAPPLLNRFEKQLLVKQNLLDDDVLGMKETVQSWAREFAVVSTFNLDDAFVGYNDDLISSLILKLALTALKYNLDSNVIVAGAIWRLLWIATPESVVRARKIPDVPAEDIYFRKQTHSSLPELLDALFQPSKETLKQPSRAELQKNICDACDAEKYITHKFHWDNRDFCVCDECYSQALKACGDEIMESHEELSPTSVEAPAKIKESAEHQDPFKEYENNKLLTIMTFTPIGSCDVQKLIKTCHSASYCNTLKLDEFSSANELQIAIQSFYQEEVAAKEKNRYLIVQCNSNTSTKRITQAQFIMEQESCSAENTKIGILLVHTRRERKVHQVTQKGNSFEVNFEKNWTFFMVDSIYPASLRGELEVTELLNGNEIDLLRNMDLSITLHRIFRSCLSRLMYPFQRTSKDIQQQIEMIIRLFEDKEFMSILHTHLFKLMEAVDTLDSQTTWQNNLALRPNEISQAGSFRAALFRRLSGKISDAFSFLLSKVDRNCNLSLFSNLKGELRTLWLFLFENLTIFDPATFFRLERYPVENDSTTTAMVSTFPFSFVFCSVLQGLHQETPGLTSIAALSQLLSTAIPSYEELNIKQESLEYYLQDLLQIEAPEISRFVPFEISRDIITKYLQLNYGTQSLQSICDIHIAFWANENMLLQVALILREVPDLSDDILRTIHHCENELSRLPHHIVDCVVQTLRPTQESWQSHEAREQWVKQVEKVLPSVDILISHHNQSKLPTNTWNALCFLRQFIREASRHFALQGNEICFEFSQLILESFDTFQDSTVLDKFTLFVSSVLGGDSTPELRRACATITELYFIEFFKNATEDHKEEFIHQAIKILLSESPEDIYNTPSLRIFILRNFLSDDNPLQMDFLEALELNEQFNSISIESGPCALFSEVSEDLLWENAPTDLLGQVAAATKLLSTFSKDDFQKYDTERVLFLRSVAASRFCLLVLARCVIENMTDKTDSFVTKMNALLAETCVPSNLRIFFLKALSKTNGTAFVQEFLQSNKNAVSFPWIQSWIDEKYVREFIQGESLLRYNFFSHDANYSIIAHAVQVALKGDFKAVEELLEDEITHNAFIFVVFNEIYSSYTLKQLPEDIQTFINRINTPEYYQLFPAPLQSILRALLTNNAPEFASEHFRNHFHLTQATTAEQILLQSIILHMFVSVQHKSFGIFHRLLHHPELFTQEFLPTMVQNVQEIEAALGNGNFYECPNGHKYFVDQCGRPMEILECLVCRARIGGEDHKLLATNKVSASKESPKGYSIDWEYEGDEIHHFERKLSPAPLRAFRLLMHILLTSRNSFICPAEEDNNLQRLITKNKETIATGLSAELLADWRKLRQLLQISYEDLTIALHSLIEALAKLPEELSSLQSEEKRDKWEEMFMKAIFDPVMNGAHLQNTIQQFYARASVSLSLENEIQESLDLHQVSEKQRVSLMPLLWRYRKRVHVQLLREQFVSDVENKNEYPVMSLFFQQEKKLRALPYLHLAIQWISLVTSQLSHRISRQDSNIQTVRQILTKLPQGAKQMWHGYKSAWNLYWPFVEYFECTEIPHSVRKIKLTDDSPIAFSLPSDRDTGIYPLAFIQQLIDTHNHFLQALQDPESLQVLQSHLISKSHMISFDIESHIAPLLCIHVVQSLQYQEGCNITFLWDRMERQMIDSVLLGKPVIQTRIQSFQFQGEMESMDAFTVVRRNIKQEQLVSLYKEKIVEELGTLQLISELRDHVDVCIGFLGITCKALPVNGKQLLVNYMSKTLLMPLEVIRTFGQTINEIVTLSNVLSLREQLTDALETEDGFDKVLESYKKPLSKRQTTELDKLKLALSYEQHNILSWAWKNFIQRQLCENSIDCNQDVKFYLRYAPTQDGSSLGDFPWFERYFSLRVRTSRCLAAYQYFTLNQ